jgi:predicted O-methyltransferase YrrM
MKKILKIIFNKKFIFYFKILYSKLTSNYVIHKPSGSLKCYIEQHKAEIKRKYHHIDNFLVYKKIDNEFINNLASITQNSIKNVKSNFQHGKIIYSELINYIKKKKKNNLFLVDVGSAKGFSSVIMAKVIKECKVKGKIFSLDIIPHNKKIYWNAPTDWKYGKISRETLLRKYNKFLKIITFYNGDSKKSLSKLKLKRIHFAFIDGSHDYEDVKKEFELISAKQNRGDIIIFDDCTKGVYDGVVGVVNYITKSKKYHCKKIYSSENRGYAVCYKI